MTGPATPDLQRRTLLAAALYPLLGERQGNAQSVSNALKVVVTGGHPGDPNTAAEARSPDSRASATG